MANPEHLARLKEGVEVWNRWRKEHPGMRPDLYEAELNLSILYLRTKHPDAALPLLREAVEQKPDKPRSKRYLADALLATNDLPNASDMYRQSLALDPKLAAAELGLGQSLERQGKLDEALPHFRQAVTLDANLKSYLLEIGSALSKAGRTDDAISVLKEFPEDLAAREELGRLYLAANRPADAIPQFQAAVSASPTAANRLALATAYLKNNQPELASPILQDELKANPKDYELLMAIGRITRDRHDYLAAAGYFTSAAQLRPASVEAWNEAAAANVLGGQFQQALAALDQIRRLNAESAGDLYFRAISLDKLHQFKPAIASYRRFLELSGGKYPDQEFLARQRSKTLEREVNR